MEQATGESVVVYTVPLVNDLNPATWKRLLYQALGALAVDGFNLTGERASLAMHHSGKRRQDCHLLQRKYA